MGGRQRKRGIRGGLSSACIEPPREAAAVAAGDEEYEVVLAAASMFEPVSVEEQVLTFDAIARAPTTMHSEETDNSFFDSFSHTDDFSTAMA